MKPKTKIEKFTPEMKALVKELFQIFQEVVLVGMATNPAKVKFRYRLVRGLSQVDFSYQDEYVGGCKAISLNDLRYLRFPSHILQASFENFVIELRFHKSALLKNGVECLNAQNRAARVW